MDRKLNQIEAGRVKTELERDYKLKVIYRILVGYTPKQIAETLKNQNKNITANVIMAMAGR